MSDEPRYEPISDSQVPQGLVWVTPDRYNGQTVEVQYSVGRPPGTGNMDADMGDPYRREVDHSDGTTSYYRRSRP